MLALDKQASLILGSKVSFFFSITKYKSGCASADGFSNTPFSHGLNKFVSFIWYYIVGQSVAQLKMKLVIGKNLHNQVTQQIKNGNYDYI